MDDATAIPMICVFAGSGAGARAEYSTAAEQMAEALVANGYGLVYGGATVGLMGTVADAVLRLGGPVVGVIPESLVAREIAHQGLSRLQVVRSMHERKALMADLSVGFVALPGGLGTLEELFEVLTWAQLGLHAKPCGLLNVAQYYDPLLAFLAHAEEEQLVKSTHRTMLQVDVDSTKLLAKMKAYEPPQVPQWLTSGEQ